MRNLIAKLQGNPWLIKRLVVIALLCAVGAGSFWWGRKQANSVANGKTDGTDDKTAKSQGGRVVAYVNGQPVSREEFGEYLIARFGTERLEFMVNRKVVEAECQKYNIYATEAEIAHRLDVDLLAYGGGSVKMDVTQFEKSVLKNFGKTLYEWKEDVIRPKIMMEKLVRGRIKVSEEDVKKGFEAKYGPKVDCRMIVLDGKFRSAAQKTWEEAKKGRSAFIAEASKQFIRQLAEAGGKVPPIHKHLGERSLEETAFAMKEGEISGLLDMRDGTLVILMCERQLPADISVKYEDVRQQLAREVTEGQVQQRVPEVFAELRNAAKLEIFPLTQPTSSIQTTSFTRESNSKVPPAPQPGPVSIAPGVEKAPSLPESAPVVPKDLPKPSEVQKK